MNGSGHVLQGLHHGLFEPYGRIRKIWREQFWTVLDNFACKWEICENDMFGRFWTFLDGFGHFWTSLDGFGHSLDNEEIELQVTSRSSKAGAQTSANFVLVGLPHGVRIFMRCAFRTHEIGHNFEALRTEFCTILCRPAGTHFLHIVVRKCRKS